MKRIYLESSVLVKRVSLEAGAEALRAALGTASADGALLLTSMLARVEVSRVLRTRLDSVNPAELTAAAYEALVGVAIAPLSRPVLESARVIGPPVLRTLDAIHVASAVSLGADELWTYDRRMTVGAEELGIRVRQPYAE